MALEFVVWNNKHTFPNQQELPDVYEDLAYNNNNALYLTSPRRYKVKVQIIKTHDGPIIVNGDNWEQFAQANFDTNVELLHFIQEGEDAFYVTGYRRNGTEAIGYTDIDIRKRFPRFMTRALPYAVVVPQTIHRGFVKKTPADNHINIKANGKTYNVGLSTITVGSNGSFDEYQINDEIWNTIEDELRLEPGMIIIFTKKSENKMWLTAFDEDGSASTVSKFHGAIPLRVLQPESSFWELDDYRMPHRCQWAWHKDHFGEEVDTFYKEYSLIQDKGRLAIPADFVYKHPMHNYSKVLMKNISHEELMTMKMVFHHEDPERTNHVEVTGPWKFLAQKCDFTYKKVIRFKFMRMENYEDAKDGEPKQYPAFHIC